MFPKRGGSWCTKNIVKGWENVMDSNEFSCRSSFVVIKLYLSHLKNHLSFQHGSLPPYRNNKTKLLKIFSWLGMTGFEWGQLWNNSRRNPQPFLFFLETLPWKKIKSLKLHIDWNLLLTMSKCLASQCLILSTLRSIGVERYYLKDTQLSHSFLLLTQSSEAHKLWQTWDVKRVSSYTSCKEDVSEDGKRMSNIKW